MRVGPFSRLRPVAKRAARKRTVPVASYHCQIKIISRSDGRSATAAAAYRAGECIVCEREGRTHDYTRKGGIEDTFIRAPVSAPGWALDRAQLWNEAEAAEKRGNSRVAREWEIALPHELDANQRRELADWYAQALVDRYGAAVDVCIHAPHRLGDQRNYHAHILVTTRKIGPDGFGAKTRVLDDKKTGPREIEATRALWADMQNDRLKRANLDARVDHRSLKDQRADAVSRGDVDAAAALDRPAEQHMGPEVSNIERRAKAQAEKIGRQYQPVTERGEAVHLIRQIRVWLDRLGEMREAVSDRVQQAKRLLSKLRGSRGQRNQFGRYRVDTEDTVSIAHQQLNPDGTAAPDNRNDVNKGKGSKSERTAAKQVSPDIAEFKRVQAQEHLRQIREEGNKTSADKPRDRGKG